MLPSTLITHLTEAEIEAWRSIESQFVFKNVEDARAQLVQAIQSGRAGQPMDGPKRSVYGLSREAEGFSTAYWSIRETLRGIHSRLCWRVLSCSPDSDLLKPQSAPPQSPSL